ncbi:MULTISPECIES: DUF3300 domain-containing protein [unclassified Herbaspirillum]|uniref:DUF3300 domain-containing protein n=1 Tax=unclassified Herbaspirillum TaxID=2624150 RepID=UPI001152FB4B|nr:MULTISPECIES: DUF3300 domain-containing protein [unclassified Herbaspirillum]MBB5391503.1 hypothetical protein [Herbaspirillum sp. SJZ102]TQK12813.1 uncharacterized protein DUF3300 [Herbaspirillum sp. SJZ130]TQK14817.1 uncharacterized protein DUF3300 [Herbaspirillum sp. SJZ106]
MTADKNRFTTLVSSSLIISLLALAGCNRADTPAAPPSNAAAAAPATLPYTPPTADQLSQMVAPIALFPDKLVAQVLAGATYPDQIASANQWLAQNPSLKGAALQDAANRQPWDVSVKSLTAFPSVLNQMAGNIQWTTALGEAYVNDPGDVMNAIQAMRLRAQQSGNLKTSQHLKITSVARAAPPDYASAPGEPPVYAGPAVIPPPPQTIVIEPAQPDVVYVPSYNPAVVYGGAVPAYPGYVYHPPVYSTGDVVATGVLSFGVGILVGAVISNHDWGWHSWGMNWGGPGSGGGPNYGGGPGGGWHRPAVVYNNTTYVSKSTTVINHIDNHNNNSRTVNNYGTTNNNNGTINNTSISNNTNRPSFNAATPNANAHMQAAPAGPMTVPHFSAGDARPGARPANVPQAQHGAGNAPMQPHANGHEPEMTPHAAAQKPNAVPAQHQGAMENRQQNAERPHRPDTLLSAPPPDAARQEHAARENMPAHQNPSAPPRPQAQPPHAQAPQMHAQLAEPPRPQTQPHVQPHDQPHPQPHPQPHMPQPHPQEHAQQHPQEHPHPAQKEERREEKRE